MKNIKRLLSTLLICSAALLSFTSCDDKMDINQTYDYELVTLPTVSSLTIGSTAEIRCSLTKTGEYDGAIYTIRYFQTKGSGVLKLDDGTTYLPNDRYALKRDEFRLYYTSDCTDSQSIDIYIEDNFGQMKKYTFDWDNKDIPTEKMTPN